MPSLAVAMTLSAGSEVINQATIHFEDETGDAHIITTNIVVITIRQVYSATLDGDRNLEGMAGKTSTFFHTLQNTGNGSDTYCMAINNTASDNGDFSKIQLIRDLNHNGRVDDSDPTLATTSSNYSTTVFLASEDIVHLIVLGDIPASATEGTRYRLLLEVKAKKGTHICQNNSVTDVGDNTDTSDDTNHDQVWITNQAILFVTKEAVYQANGEGIDDDTIAYQISIQNKGNGIARDIIITDILPQNTRYQANSLQTASDFSATPGIDDGANGTDGRIPSHDGNFPGQITGEIDTLAVDAEVIFTYVLDIDNQATGGSVIENTISVQGDLDENNATDEPIVISNKTTQTVPRFYAIQMTDTGTGMALNINDGGDDDGTLNDQQYVDQAAQGALVLFNHQVTNQGNTSDTFSLMISNSTFPENTVFQLYHENQSTTLLDTTGDGHPDTGLLAPGEQLVFVICAMLPANSTITGPFVATVTAQSSGNKTIQDTSQIRLGEITAHRVDIANTETSPGLHNEIDADPVSQITTTKIFSPNKVISFDLFIANEGLRNDQYQLTVWMDSLATIRPPENWTVKFVKDSGEIISTTPSISPGNTYFCQVQVLVPEDHAPQLIPIFFKVYSSVTGVWDIKQDAIQILPLDAIRMTPDNESSVAPGGAVEYFHTIQNIGNTPVAVKISVLSQTLMSHSLLLPQLFTGSHLSLYQNIQNFSVGDKMVIFDKSENQWQIISLVSDNAGSIAIPLDPDDSVQVKVRVIAPTQIAPSSIDILIVQASVVDSASTASNTDRTIAASSQLQITKMGAIDTTCDSDMNSLNKFIASHFQAHPGECIVWQITAVNNSAEPVCKVTLHDKAPAFTFIQGAPIIYTQPDPGDTGFCSVNAEEMECCVGNPMDINKDGIMESHCLKSGERAEIRFRVEIE
ncbi:MAG: hypothetical protein HQK75_17125 [Candidatus Magnetomorum sp.]|nr:hypothetical protein [Candidatus Magnetomorum sp.]